MLTLVGFDLDLYLVVEPISTVPKAFGAFARVLPELKHLTSGLELADSIASDGWS